MNTPFTKHDHTIPKLIPIREVKRRYRKIDRTYGEVAGEENAYVCNSCGVTTGTIIIDTGVTPMFIPCPSCGKTAVSQWGMVKHTVSHEWYRPSLEWCLKKRRNRELLEHIFQGGLVLRPCKK